MNDSHTLNDVFRYFRMELSAHYPVGEIDALFATSVEELSGIQREDFPLRGDEKLRPGIIMKMKNVVNELKLHRPIQYILGSLQFHGCRIRVNEHVLIPRPETEELVEWVVQTIRSMKKPDEGPSILDIGTGSGCIAIALKKKLPWANVSGIDISDDALLVAKANALLNHTKINFLQGDITASIPVLTVEAKPFFDIVVSNPPYVRISEKAAMDKNVRNFEPHLALFVNDDDSLLFYRAIADFAWRHLTGAGKLFFEINEKLGGQVKALLEQKGFMEVHVKKDINGKDRFVIAQR